jgi:uncharacterized protein YjiS (DUF1127 family)
MNSLVHIAGRALLRPDPLAGLRRLARGVPSTLALWAARARQRRELLELDDRLLRDIDVSRTDAEREARKPFWRA